MTVDGTGSCIGEKINPPAGSKAGIRKLGYVRVAQRLDQALRGQNYYAMGTGQWHLRYFNDNNNMSRLLMGKGTK
jgi:hypothetical protein